MRMITIICREKLEREVVQLLNTLGVQGYTTMSGLGGKGLSGAVSEHGWIERNMKFVVVLGEEQATSLASAVKQLYAKLLEQQSGEKVPLRVFSVPCDLIL
jgi:nitrogen regulatory protein PII